MIIDNHGLCKELFNCIMAITHNTRRNVSKFGMHCFQAFDHIRYDPELSPRAYKGKSLSRHDEPYQKLLCPRRADWEEFKSPLE